MYNSDEFSDGYLKLTTAEISHYYQQYGYVVWRNLIPSTLCNQVKQLFNQQIKPYQGYLYRQASANPEKHQLSEHGYILNPLLNVQDLEMEKFFEFKQTSLSILTHENIYQAIFELLKEEGMLIQSMFFEGNPATWAHQDSYYLDSSQLGRMIGVWIALEDIQEGAGRFFVYPKSHQIKPINNQGEFEIAFHHEVYKKEINKTVQTLALECRAPALRQGDVLFWNSQTIHGSLATTTPEFSRFSLTAHYIPLSTQLLQYQKRIIPLNLRKINRFWVHSPKNLDVWQKRAIFHLEIRFPNLFKIAKRLGIKLILK